MDTLRGCFRGTTQVLPVWRKASAKNVRSVIVAVATPTKPPAAKVAKRSKVEHVKEKSDYLRHPLMQELVNENTFISEEAVQLMKFHGSYQQTTERSVRSDRASSISL